VRSLTIAALLVLALAPAALALDVPPPPTRWVTDGAGVLSTTEVSMLDSKLENFEQTSGAQFIIYVFPGLEGESVEDFTIRCVERWKVGQKKYDNGLVLFVFVKDRKVRVEVGYGLEGTITDAFSSRVIREYIAPHFQKNEYGPGLTAAADAIIAKIKGGEAPVPPLQPKGSETGGGGGDSVSPFTVIVILFIVFFVVVPMISRSRGGRGGGGGGCFWPLMFLNSGGRGTTFGGGGFSSGGGFGGGGGFSGGGGGFGGGGATGGW
jgi:uncharacterized protein